MFMWFFWAVNITPSLRQRGSSKLCDEAYKVLGASYSCMGTVLQFFLLEPTGSSKINLLVPLEKDLRVRLKWTYRFVQNGPLLKRASGLVSGSFGVDMSLQ